jgi:hypothetical protein
VELKLKLSEVKEIYKEMNKQLNEIEYGDAEKHDIRAFISYIEMEYTLDSRLGIMSHVISELVEEMIELDPDYEKPPEEEEEEEYHSTDWYKYNGHKISDFL